MNLIQCIRLKIANIYSDVFKIVSKWSHIFKKWWNSKIQDSFVSRNLYKGYFYTILITCMQKKKPKQKKSLPIRFLGLCIVKGKNILCSASYNIVYPWRWISTVRKLYETMNHFNRNMFLNGHQFKVIVIGFSKCKGSL